jgi:hypothetical protein
LLPVVFGTTNSRTHGSMHFVEITEIAANDKNTFTRNKIILELCEIPKKLRHLAYLDITLDNNTLTELQKLKDALLPGDEMIYNRN